MKTIVAQLLTTIYSDGTKKVTAYKALSTTGKVKRDSKGRYQSITPDTVVTCPNCGHEFRVGKYQ